MKPVATFCSFAFAAIASAQWTVLPPVPCIWPYGDSISEPPSSQMRNLSRSFSIFANGRFYLFGGRSGQDYCEGQLCWHTSNRHSKACAFDPASGTWECGGVQSQHLYTGAVTRSSQTTFYVGGNLTGSVSVGDELRVESGEGIVLGEIKSFLGKVNTLVFDGSRTTVGLVRGEVPGTWVPHPSDKIFRVSVVGITPVNNGNGRDVPRAGEGYSVGNHTMTAAYDRNGDGLQEIFLIGGYPHWTPQNVDVYDPARNEWSRATGNRPGSVNEQRTAGAQVGSRFCWVGNDLGGEVHIYDFISDAWSVDTVPGLMLDIFSTGQGFPELGPNGAVFYFGGDAATKKTVRYNVLQGSFSTLAPPPVTANQGGSARYGKYVILLGGRTGPGVSTATDAIQVYDTETDTWFISPVRMPFPVSGIAVGTAPDGTIYVAGGVDKNIVWRDDAYSIHASLLLTCGIAGTLDLEFHEEPLTVPVRVEVYEPGGTTPIATVPLSLTLLVPPDPENPSRVRFEAGLGLPPGNYDLRFRAANFLAKRLRSVSLPFGTTVVGNLALINGDGNGDNRVDLPDLNMPLVNFGRTGPAGDYTGDGYVRLPDLNVPLQNFNKQGDH